MKSLTNCEVVSCHSINGILHIIILFLLSVEDYIIKGEKWDGRSHIIRSSILSIWDDICLYVLFRFNRWLWQSGLSADNLSPDNSLSLPFVFVSFVLWHVLTVCQLCSQHLLQSHIIQQQHTHECRMYANENTLICCYNTVTKSTIYSGYKGKYFCIWKNTLENILKMAILCILIRKCPYVRHVPVVGTFWNSCIYTILLYWDQMSIFI